jgi:hypothetical protein
VTNFGYTAQRHTLQVDPGNRLYYVLEELEPYGEIPLLSDYSGTTLLYKIKVVAWIIIFVLCCLFCITTPIIRRYIYKQEIRYCIAIVTSSRPLEPIGSRGNECWLKLSEGVPAELTFNEPAQITYGTLTGGDDSFFFNAKKGDTLSNVTGATIRPMLHIESKFGSLDALKDHEIEYHRDLGACLRDANHENEPLTEFCAEE